MTVLESLDEILKIIMTVLKSLGASLGESIATSSLTGNARESCLPHFWRKTLIFSLVFLTAWTFTKVPYYIGFDADGDTAYEKGGLTGSINLAYWVKGYESSKLHSPACNFLLVHIAFGSTVLIMMALSLIKTAWRKKYGYYFFTSALLLGVHTIPAAWKMGSPFTKYAFTFTSVYVIIASLFGYRTLKFYDTDPVKHEKHLLIEYSVVTFGAYGAGFAESIGILKKFMFKAETGAFKVYPTTPDPLFGHSVYDILPEKVGMTIFFAWAAVFWFWWPIKLLEIDTNIDSSKKPDGATTERTRLV